MKLVISILFMQCILLQQVQAQVSNEPFTYVERMPEFPEGQTEMYKFIYSNIKYPAEAKRFDISGQVITQFVVDTTGYLINIRVVRGLSGGLNEEAMRIVELMNVDHRWTPGTHNGRPVPVTYTLPIKFVLKSER